MPGSKVLAFYSWPVAFRTICTSRLALRRHGGSILAGVHCGPCGRPRVLSFQDNGSLRDATFDTPSVASGGRGTGTADIPSLGGSALPCRSSMALSRRRRLELLP